MAILDTIKNQFNQNQASEDEAPAAASAKNIIRRLCPKCHGSILEFTESDSHVMCYACDITSSVSELLAAPASASADAAPSAAVGAAPVAVAVDSPESGLIYLENYFANYDWADYNRTSIILISAINKMVEDNKIKQGAAPASWLLDFLSVSVPLKMKLKGLAPQAADIAEAYNDEDNTNALGLFDRYRNILNALLAQKDALIKRLENDIEFAQRQGLEAAKLEEIKADLASIKADLDQLQTVEKITDLPAIAAKQAEIDARIVQSFRDRGIDVVAEYEKACNLYKQSGSDKRDALKIFESIRGYADTFSYIQKINHFFRYGQVLSFYGKYFLYKETEKNLLALDPTTKGDKKGCLAKKKADAPAPAAAPAAAGKKGCLAKKGADEASEEESCKLTTYELFEVINGEPSDEPLLKGITEIIKYYGSVFFYVRYGRTICAYDMATKTGRELLTVDDADKLHLNADNGNYRFYNKRWTSMYVLKNLEAEEAKVGCLDRLRGKKTLIEHRNNYEVYELNFANVTCNRVVDQAVDLIHSYGDLLFYTYTEELPEGQVETEETKKQPIKLNVMIMHTQTLKKATLFKEDCKIRTVIGGTRIVYTKRSSNSLNLDLYIFDITSKTNTLIENNIYTYEGYSDGRVYYRVGGRYSSGPEGNRYQYTIAPLFSNKLDGTDRYEVMPRLSSIVKIEAGWMYVIKGEGRNTALFKVSTDGTQVIFVCSQLKKVLKTTDSHIYYLTVDNDLRIVRTDGQENTLISNDIDANDVQIDEDYIYFLRYEDVAYRKYSTPPHNDSLYKMDIDGHNLRKLLFNVEGMRNFDQDTLYIEMKDQIRYHIFVPAPRKKDEKEYEETFPLTRYYTYDKTTGKLTNVVTLGMPHPDKIDAKGCFGKKKDMESIFTEIPIEDDYEEIGERAGAVFADEQSAQNPTSDEENNGGCNKSGCSKLGNKGGEANGKPGCANANQNAGNGGCLVALKK